MNKELLPTIETLNKLLICDAEAGKLYWRKRTPDLFEDRMQSARHVCARWNARYANKEALVYMNDFGYFVGCVTSIHVRAHRVIWAMETGDWPEDQIDHINHDRTDNRIKNLRSATHIENCKNQTVSKSNTSGHTGVYWCKWRNKWRVQIMVGGKNKTLGRFTEKADAIHARKKAEIKYGFHENHGK